MRYNIVNNSYLIANNLVFYKLNKNSSNFTIANTTYKKIVKHTAKKIRKKQKIHVYNNIFFTAYK